MAKKIYTLAERKVQFLQAAVVIARKVGVDKLTVTAVAGKCKVSGPMVFKVFGSRDALRKAVTKELGGAAKKTADKNYRKAVAKVTKVAAKKSAAKPAKKAARTASAGAKSAAKPARKRSIKEVKAIKDKAAGKRAPGVHKDTKPNVPKVAQAVKKYQPAAAPTNVNPNPEPKATLA